MLANLLPGLRELRTPLAVGWTWFAALWVALGGIIPSKLESTGLLRAIYDLGAALGQGGVLGVLAFAAYLVGSLAQQDPKVWIRLIRSGRRGSLLQRRVLYPIAVKISDMAEELSGSGDPEEVYRILRGDLNIEEKQETGEAEMLDSAADIVLDQNAQLEALLLSQKRDVYDYYDRLRESSDLRLNLAPPVAVLGLATAVRLFVEDQPVWGLLTLALAIAVTVALLLRQGAVLPVATGTRGRHRCRHCEVSAT